MTLLELKAQIADDLNRSDMTSQIANAISSAISFYSATRWWWLFGRATAETVADQAFYAVPTDMMSTDTLLITISTSKDPLDHVEYDDIDSIDSGLYTGQPDRWAYYQDQIRLYPIPDDAYTLTLSYHKKLEDLEDSESNAWTTTAKDLIRYRALAEIYTTILKDDAMASKSVMDEGRVFSELQTLNVMRSAPRRIRKTSW